MVGTACQRLAQQQRWPDTTPALTILLLSQLLAGRRAGSFAYGVDEQTGTETMAMTCWVVICWSVVCWSVGLLVCWSVVCS